MSSSPTGCCAVQWAMWKGGGLTSRDRLDSSENYLLLGFLLVRLSQTVLLLVRQPITQNYCSISVSYRSSSNVKWWKNTVTFETEIPLFKRVELGQETVQSRNEVLPFLWIMETIKKCKQTNKHQIFNLTAAFFLTLYWADLPEAWLVTAVQPVFNPFNQFVPQLELYSQLQLSLWNDPITLVVPNST